MRRRKDKGRLPPFVPLLKDTLASPAWRAMSTGARCLYVALKMRYSSGFKNNGRLYLAQRDAANEVGSGTTQIGRWFRELQYYGFIVMTESGSLGVDGKGKAPHWRLTECGTLADPMPTRDFIRWNGVKFSKHRPGGDDKTPKRKPVPENRDTLSRKTGTPLSRETGTVSGETVPENRDIYEHPTVPENRDITSLPLPARFAAAPNSPPDLQVITGGKGKRRRKRPWSIPIVVDGGGR